MSLMFNVAAYAALLMLPAYGAWRFPRASLVAILALCVGGTALWLQSPLPQSVFLWIKLYSLIVAFLWCALLRCTALSEKPWALFTILLILWGNIAEAVIEDLLTGHYINATAGLLLIAASTPDNWRRAVHLGAHARELLWPTTRAWIIGYTVWNLVFVFTHFNADFATGGLLVLGTALAVGLLFPARWLFFRATILLMHMVFLFSPNDFLLGLRWQGWQQLQWILPLEILSLLVCCVPLYQWWCTHNTALKR